MLVETPLGIFSQSLTFFLQGSFVFFIIPGIILLIISYFYKRFFKKQNINYLGAKIIILVIPSFLLSFIFLYTTPTFLFRYENPASENLSFTTNSIDYVFAVVFLFLTIFYVFLTYRIIKTYMDSLTKLIKFLLAVYILPISIFVILYSLGYKLVDVP